MSLHVKLNPPAGYRPYGANVNYAPSGEVVDGLPVHYFAQCGWGPATVSFGDYVFRQVGNRQAEYVFYKAANEKDPMDGRGDLVAYGGKLYITGQESDTDKLPVVYEVPGYVGLPQGTLNLTLVGDASVRALLERIAALEARIVQLEQRPVVVTDLSPVTKRLDAVAAVADKANERGQNALTQLSQLKPGISREDAWQLAADRIYTELGDPQSGISARVRSLVGGVTGGIDQGARDIANEALRRATDAKAIAAQAVEQVGAAAKGAIDTWLATSIAYTDTRLLNLMWDRCVKLLRYKEKSGKTAEQLPVNDVANISK